MSHRTQQLALHWHAIFHRSLTLLVLGLSGVLPAGLSKAAETTSVIPIDRCGISDFKTRVRTGGAQVVIVGISNYADKQILPRKHAEADAIALYNLFVDDNRFGVPAGQIQLLLGKPVDSLKSQPATRANILKALNHAVLNTGDDDLLVFAFFGQGASLGKTGSQTCYLASNSTVAGRAIDAISDSDLNREFNRIGAPRVCAILDVYFKGVAKEAAVPEPDPGALTFRSIGGRERGQWRFASGRALFLASGGTILSPDAENHGVFASVLLKGLRGDADQESPEPDGLVSIYEMSRYMSRHVPDETFRVNPRLRDSIHYSGTGIHSDFPIMINPAKSAAAVAEAQQFDTAAGKGSLDAELVAEGRQLLNRAQQRESQKQLRKLYQGYAAGRVTESKLISERRAILKSSELSRGDADAFADKILDAIRLIEIQYVRRMNPGQMVGWAIDALYQHADELVPEGIQGRLEKRRTLDAAALKQLLSDARLILGNREDLQGHAPIDAALQGMLPHLDSLCRYYTPDEVAQELDTLQIRHNFTGIGAVLMLDPESEYILIKSPIKGGPAQKAGIQAGDVLLEVANEFDEKGTRLKSPDVMSTQRKTVEEVRNKVIGSPGTSVKLTVRRPGGAKETLTITRGTVDLESVLGIARLPSGEWQYMADDVTKTGYIRISTFGSRTKDELESVIKSLIQQGMRGLILDLRYCPGGLLQSCLGIADMLVEDDTLVIVRSRTAPEDRRRGAKAGSFTNFPMVCLVNSNTGSGSEIIAACLQYHGRATVVGERTNGSASVQTFIDFDGGRLKLTINTFVGPSGRNLDRENSGNSPDEWGVYPDPDFALKLTREESQELYKNLTDGEVLPRTDSRPPSRPSYKDPQLDLARRCLKESIARGR